VKNMAPNITDSLALARNRVEPGAKVRMISRAENLGKWSLRLGLFLYCIFPLYWMVVSSIKTPPELLAYPPTFVPHDLSFGGYNKLFNETNFWTYFINSVIISGIATVIVVILGAIAAYGLTRYQYRGRETIAKFLLLAYMFPPIVLIVPLFIFASSLGLTNSRVGVALSYISFSLPYAIWILRAFFQSLPVELEQAAWIDGATRRQGLFYIVIPLALPGIIATSIFTFIVAWNDFLFASVLIATDPLKTLPVGINDFFHMAVVDWRLIMAAGVMITIPAVIFFVAVQQYLVEGWGAGGVKG